MFEGAWPLAVAVAAIGGGYIWVAPQWFGLTNGLAISDQIAFALKAGAARRSFGMALTAAPTFASYFLAAGLMVAGR